MSFLANAFGATTPKAAPQIGTSFVQTNAGGLQTWVGSDNIAHALPDSNRLGVVGNLGQTYGTLGDETGALRATVAPGFNDLLSARIQQINDSARTAVGNLRQNLSSRRILGSSFGQDTLTRAGAEFSRQKDQATADNFLQSLDVNNKLLNQQYAAYSQQFQTGLNELNLESSIATSLASGASSIIAANAQLQAKLDQQNNQFRANANLVQEQGIGKLLGGFLGGSGPIGGSGGTFSGNMSQGYSTDPGSLAQSSMGGGAGGGVFV